MWIGMIGRVGERGVSGWVVLVDGGEERESRCEAVRRGPMVFVWRWWAKDENELWVRLGLCV